MRKRHAAFSEFVSEVKVVADEENEAKRAPNNGHQMLLSASNDAGGMKDTSGSRALRHQNLGNSLGIKTKVVPNNGGPPVRTRHNTHVEPPSPELAEPNQPIRSREWPQPAITTHQCSAPGPPSSRVEREAEIMVHTAAYDYSIFFHSSNCRGRHSNRALRPWSN